jgi:hypothetical protein
MEIANSNTYVSDGSGGNLKRASGNGREVPSNKDLDLKMKIKGQEHHQGATNALQSTATRVCVHLLLNLHHVKVYT